MDKIKVMIVDDHVVVREGVKQLLSLEDDIEVVTEANNGLECLKIIEKLCPDLILMDIMMPGISGIETTRLVCEKYPNIKVIILTIYEDNQYVTEAIQAGAKGYVLKKTNRDELVRVIHHVMEDRAFLDPSVTATVFDHLKKGKRTFEKTGKEQFTQRELEVLRCIIAGLHDDKIAKSLFISTHTVRSHIKSLFRKLNVSSKLQAATKAISNRIITGNK